MIRLTPQKKTLLKICNNHNLRIGNGQSTGDRLGNYTYFNYEGASVVDYIIMEETIYEKILNFKVLPPTIDSKHSPTVATFKCNTTLQKKKEKLLNPPKTYKWESQNFPLFKILINSQESQIKIKALCNNLDINKNNSNFQYVIGSFTKFMTECADKTLKRKKRPIKNKRHSKPWYNETCKTLKKQFEQLAKLIQKFPKDPHTLGQCNKIKKKYKHTIKSVKQKWEIENIRNLSSDPKLFWQHVKKVRGKTNNSSNQADSIPTKKWVEHFSSLFNVTESDKNKLEGSNKILPDSKYDPILDSLFTIEEILKGIRELKLRKANRNDSNSNEMIIARAPTLLPFLVTFFNEI